MFTASTDGYIRLLRVKEQKNLEITTQINLMDKILHAFPMIPKANVGRTFTIVLHRGGIVLAKACDEKEYQA
jgi:hypothetical protein